MHGALTEPVEVELTHEGREDVVVVVPGSNERSVHTIDMIINEIIDTRHHYFKLHYFLIAEDMLHVSYFGRISCAKLSGCRMQNALPPLHHRTCLKKKTQIRGEHVEQTARGMQSEVGEKQNVSRTGGARGSDDQAGGQHQKFIS